ncbi:MAG: SpoIID/LytB domain-containing protein [Elusimicrobia bacterium]|nr:SpoIID/LytB domain-containing protein [Elusimicrobiota bacterium]MDE2424866.1 SpoIID/LytB domain-containing protein [Elusimicrobiota bacterium]
MSRYRISLLCLAACLPALCAQPGGGASAAGERRILIGLVPRADSVVLIARGRFSTSDDSGRKIELPQGRRLLLEPADDNKRLVLGRAVLPPLAKLVPEELGATIEIAGKRYDGSFLLRLNTGGRSVTVIDRLRMEDYLLGVLPYEMDPAWPMEALKAQAVVARTFAYTQLGKYRLQGFDLTADTRSQVFGGVELENWKVRKAVESTRGEVLGYKGKILDVYYHACCGGHTENAARVWGGTAPPPLWGVRDPYCRRSPLYRWTAFFSTAKLISALLENRLTGGRLKRFEIGQEDRAGYAITFLARVGMERIRMNASRLRRALGGIRLPSLNIQRLRKVRGGVEFIGRGAGHGVGLCQWGARVQAEKGRSYERILSFYFPGSVLSIVDDGA